MNMKIITKIHITTQQLFILMFGFFLFVAPIEAVHVAPRVTNNQVSTRIKDVAFFDGVRENQLIGYGIVVGLNGTGDSLSSSPFTKESLISMLERLGINTRNINMDAKNVAAVMVTANLPPFGRQGATIDVNASSLGSAKSLLGGTLLVTPLYGADGQVYAVAQGAVAAIGYTVGGQGATQTKGVPTNARIANGAIIEREMDFQFGDQNFLRLSLRNPDFTTIKRVSEVINAQLGTNTHPIDVGTLHIDIPVGYKDNLVALITQIEQLEVAPDQRARVLMDAASGIVVIGENVKISKVAVAHGSLTIQVKDNQDVSQPNSFGGGNTQTTTNTEISVNEGSTGNMVMLESGATLQNLIDSLNAIGVTPRDLIAILQVIKAAGALHADLEML
ncbi:flagellar basal body P-ring protein FlgI [Candidatus Bodocaedibacter vickermanii]